MRILENGEPMIYRKRIRRCINLGSGALSIESTKDEKWINMDINYYDGVDIVKDCSRGIPIDENTISKVLMSHLIEHLDGEQIEYTFRDLYRICKNGAEITILTPHYLHPSSWGDYTHKQHLSEWFWEHMQCKQILLPKKIEILWRFNIKEIKIHDGELKCIYIVNKSKNYMPTKVEFEKVKK